MAGENDSNKYPIEEKELLRKGAAYWEKSKSNDQTPVAHQKKT